MFSGDINKILIKAILGHRLRTNNGKNDPLSSSLITILYLVFKRADITHPNSIWKVLCMVGNIFLRPFQRYIMLTMIPISLGLLESYFRPFLLVYGPFFSCLVACL